MTAALFNEWYRQNLHPWSEKAPKALSKEGSEVLLTADNAPSDSTEELLERGNCQFKTIFLPPDVTSLLQSMDQSVIDTMKHQSNRQLLRTLLVECEDERQSHWDVRSTVWKAYQLKKSRKRSKRRKKMKARKGKMMTCHLRNSDRF